MAIHNMLVKLALSDDRAASGDDLNLGNLDVTVNTLTGATVTAANFATNSPASVMALAGTVQITGALTMISGTATLLVTNCTTLLVSGDATISGHLQSNGNEARTATTGGGTTGLITQGTSFVTVTSDDANKQISLPAATIGDRIRILVGTTGCELISSVAAHKVNDVTVGATNEAALTAENLYDCQYVATNKWVVIGYTKLGAVQSALIPDAL